MPTSNQLYSLPQEEFQLDVDTLGQVFTPPDIVKQMLALRQNRSGTVLEPSTGGGAFMSVLDSDAVGIELDPSITTDSRVMLRDFFDYPITNKFDTIIGNPPYVRFQDISPTTRSLLKMDWFDRRSNLYLFFIAKCMDHLQSGGELIFITPRDFLKSTSSRILNRELHREGVITHFYELGDQQIFPGYSPNCAIWRWQKGRRNYKTAMGNTFCYHDGQLWFGKKLNGPTVGDYFHVKVGAVSGADSIFTSDKYGTLEFVSSRTRTDGFLRPMIYNTYLSYLEPYKQQLLQRRIRRFTEADWWTWGRAYHVQEGPRIYVNAKTRQLDPFFVSSDSAYDGSVIGLFPKKDIDLDKAVDTLNALNWENLGFVCDGRLMLTQRSLQNMPIGTKLK